jgi:hypothetical protein
MSRVRRFGSAMTDAAADVTEKHRKLMVAPAAGTTSIWEKGRKYLIMVRSPLEAATAGTIDLAARNGLKTIAVISVDTLPAKAVARGALELAKKDGLRAAQRFRSQRSGFNPLLQTCLLQCRKTDQ